MSTERNLIQAQMFIFFPSRMEASEILRTFPNDQMATEWDYCLLQYDDGSEDVAIASDEGWFILEGGVNHYGFEITEPNDYQYEGKNKKFFALAS